MHFYKSDGTSMHTIVGKNGKERTTSIADARKLGLFPSVTTIMDIPAKPALIEWLQQELLAAAIEQPYHPHEWNIDEWKKVILNKMRTKSRKAAERGTEIHGKLDQFFTTKTQVLIEDDAPYLMPAIERIDKTFGLGGWISEKTFTNKEQGFAGCVDLHHPEKNIIIDFKTKNKEGLKGVKQYDDHKMQLAAYQLGLRMPNNTRRFNLFISTSYKTPGQCLLEECTEFDRSANMFYHLHMFWVLKNKYDPTKGAVSK